MPFSCHVKLCSTHSIPVQARNLLGTAGNFCTSLLKTLVKALSRIGPRGPHGANPERSITLSVSALTQSLQLNCGAVFLHHVHQSISGKSPFILGAVLGLQCHLGRPATCQASSSVDIALIKTDKNPFFPRVYLLEEGHSNGT